MPTGISSWRSSVRSTKAQAGEKERIVTMAVAGVERDGGIDG